MRRIALASGLKLLAAIIVVVVADAMRWLWLAATKMLVRLGQCGKLPRLRARIARLPPGVALPLFLVPEICSRCGWVASAWLLLQGETMAAVLVYAGSKLIAGLAALWVYQACEPALMQVRWFAALARRVTAMAAALRARLALDDGHGGGSLPVADAREWLGRDRRRWGRRG